MKELLVEGQSEGASRDTFAAECARVAATSSTVLIEGELGSGKSWTARCLHDLSPRRSAAFVTVDLAALPAALIEAELFGHAAGAYTGAQTERLGRVRKADGGTLVLEGIENLPLELQVKLLRVLQERQVEPLGSERVIAVDLRVIATASGSLAELVQLGRFRQDLYWRLAVCRLHVPPLRARRAELPGLVRNIAAQASRRAAVPARPISERTLEHLATHPWPGNLRELENALERVLVMGAANPGPIEPEEFPFLADALGSAASDLARSALAHGLTLPKVELALLQEALQQERGNQSAAARALGLSRRAFEYRLLKLRDSQASEPGVLGEDPA